MSAGRHKFLHTETVSLKYTIWPGGPVPLLCFHGFGQDHAVYKSVSESLKGTHTIYSFDLPFHGETQWHAGDKSFLPEDWFELLVRFLEEEAIQDFEVMGYSMGGKYAMVAAQLFPGRIRHLRLLAPDGITTHFSYRYSHLFFPFPGILKAQIKKPTLFKGMVSFSRTFRLQDNYTLKFAENQMDTEFKRSQVYHSWVALRHFMPDLHKVTRAVSTPDSQLSFYLGIHDKIINKKEVKPLMNLVPQHELIELESGHSKLVEIVSEYLA